MQKKVSVKTLTVLKLLFSPWFQGKDVQSHLESATLNHCEFACAKLNGTQVHLGETLVQLCQLHDRETKVNIDREE